MLNQRYVVKNEKDREEETVVGGGEASWASKMALWGNKRGSIQHASWATWVQSLEPGLDEREEPTPQIVLCLPAVCPHETRHEHACAIVKM